MVYCVNFRTRQTKGGRPVNFPLLLLLLLRLLGCPMSTTGKRGKEGFSILQIKRETKTTQANKKPFLHTRLDPGMWPGSTTGLTAPVFTSGYSPREEEGNLSP